MSIKLMSIAWDMDIPSTEKMVLLCLCDYADDNGRSCYPAISTLAKRTSKNARTVQRALRWLEQAGICDSHERAGTSTNYTISLGGDILSGVTKTTKGGGKVSGEGWRGVTQSINEPSKEPSVYSPSDDEPISEKEIIDAWNILATNHGLPKVAKLTADRKRKLAAMRKQSTIEELQAALGAISRCKWMHGDNDRGWRADFDFFLQPKSFTKLIEGSYDQK